VLVFLALGMISAQASQLQILQSLNLVRADPKIAASWIKLRYLDNGKRGIANDDTCYQDAYDYLMKASPVQLISEDAGIDLAAFVHAKDQVEASSFTHNLNDGTTPSVRLRRFGTFSGAWGYTQLVALFERSTAVPANDVIMLFASDCGVKSRKHRQAIFSNDYSVAGAGMYKKERKNVFTLVLTKGFVRAPIQNAQLDQAGLEGNGKFTGVGKSWETATFRVQGEFTHPGDQIHSAAAIEALDDSTGALGDLKDDSSVKCPTQINNEALEIKTVKPWTKTSQKCTRNSGDFTTADNLDRLRPFAQKGKCYQRFRFCSPSGAVWTYDREYKTAAAASTPLTDVKNELLDALGDVTVVCPTWVSPKLRIRTVSNWHVLNGKTCARGTGFNAEGVKRDAPFAKKGKCFHRQQFCDAQGRIWAKDSEYHTYAEWASLKRK